MVQLTNGRNAYKDADGFLRIEEKEFEQPSNALWGRVSFSEAKQRALEEARRHLLKQIHEANRRELQRQRGGDEAVQANKDRANNTMNILDPTTMNRWIDGDPNMSLNDIKLGEGGRR